MTGELKAFVTSKALIRHIVVSQAGTIEKAVLEAVSNGIDAKARRIEVLLEAPDRIVVVDDGHGFRSEAEIEERFGTLGRADEDRREEREDGEIGEFGIGRVQLAAFGPTTWETGPWRIHVDIEALGLGYTMEALDGPPVAGCRVICVPREPLGASARAVIRTEVGRRAAWVEPEVWIDGRRTSRRVDKARWTDERDGLLWRERDGDGGVEVYSQGVYVRTYAHHRVGVSGLLVSRASRPFRLNMARNDILQQHCALWPVARRLMRDEAGTRRARRSLRDADREALWREIAAGDVRIGPAEPVVRQRIVKTAGGRCVSIHDVWRRHGGRVSVAPVANDLRAERAQEAGRALMLAPVMMEWLGVETPRGLVTAMSRCFEAVWPSGLEHVAYEEAVEGMEGEHRIIRRKDWTRHEQAAMRGLEQMNGGLWRVYCERGRRKLVLGESPTAEAWTDGKRWIAIDRAVLKRAVGRGMRGWIALSHLLLHEYAHDGADGEAHEHTFEFYREVHDWLLAPWWDGFATGAEAMQAWRTACKRLELVESPRAARRHERMSAVAPPAQERETGRGDGAGGGEKPGETRGREAPSASGRRRAGAGGRRAKEAATAGEQIGLALA